MRPPERNWGCRVSDEYTFKGMRTLVLENDKLRVSVLLDKGADIFELLYKPLDLDVMLRALGGVVNPARSFPSTASDKGSFLDLWYGGWQECFPVCGNPTSFYGADFGIHGEVFALPWQHQIVRDDPECVQVHLWVRTLRMPFLLEKTLTLRRGESVLTLDERATNEGAIPLHYMWGQHPAIGAPLLDDSCVLDAPAATVVIPDESLWPRGRCKAGYWGWPIVPGRDGGEVDLSRVLPATARTADGAYLKDFRSGWCALTNQRMRVGFALTWPKEIFPWMWFWQVYGGEYAAPLFGRTYNVSLEPFTTYPPDIHEAVRLGEAPLLQPGESVSATLRAIVYTGLSRVTEIDDEGCVRGSEAT